MRSLTTADIPLLRATLTIEEVLLLLPPNPGLCGAARMAGKRPTRHEEALWGLLPALSCVEYSLDVQATHAKYIDRRSLELALRVYGDREDSLAASLRDLQSGLKDALSEEARRSLNNRADSYGGSADEDIARALSNLLFVRPKPTKDRAKFIELVALRKLFVYTGEAAEEDAWMVIVQEMLALCC